MYSFLLYFSVFVLSFFTIFISFRLAYPLKVRIVDHRLTLLLFRLPFRNGAHISFLFGHLFRKDGQISFRFPFLLLPLLKVQTTEHYFLSFLFRLLFRNGAQISLRFAFLFGHLNRNGVNIPFRFAFLFPHLIPHLQKVLRRCSDLLLSLVPQDLPAP